LDVRVYLELHLSNSVGRLSSVEFVWCSPSGTVRLVKVQECVDVRARRHVGAGCCEPCSWCLDLLPALSAALREMPLGSMEDANALRSS